MESNAMCCSEEKRSVTSAADEDVPSSEANDDSQRGSIDHQSPQPDLGDGTNAQHDVLPVDEVTQLEPATASTEGGSDWSPELDMHAVCLPGPTAKSEDGGPPTDGLRPTVVPSPPPLPSPPSVTAEVTVVDDDATNSLVITDVAKYVSKRAGLIRQTGFIRD